MKKKNSESYPTKSDTPVDIKADEEMNAYKLIAVRERATRHTIPVIEEGQTSLDIGACCLFERDNRRFFGNSFACR